MAKRHLAVNVNIDGTLYGPDGEQDVPKDVAEQIGDHAWQDDDLEARDSYAGLSASELKSEIKARNEGREEADKLSASGSKEELAARLLADDEPHTP
jgi:hypothetical protein